MNTKLFSTAAAVGGLLLMAASAQALTVSIQLNETAGPTITGPTQVGTDPNGSASFNGAFGNFNNNITGTGSGSAGLEPEPTLVGATTNVSATCGNCTIAVMITETGLTFPMPSALFTVNDDWLNEKGDVTNVTFKSWVDASDTAYGTGEQLGSDFTPSGTGATVFSQLVNDLNGSSYSETEEFDISFGTCGTGAEGQPAACSVQLSSQLDAVVPEPASLTLLGSALLGFGAWRRRRKAEAV